MEDADYRRSGEGGRDDDEGLGIDSDLRNSAPRDYDKGDTDIDICIAELQVREGKLGTKHVVYRIKGKDRDGEFELFRRYSDFDAIRAVLVSRWPGVAIPTLPSKKSLGNLEGEFIKDRMKYLEIFLIRISEMSSLYYSEEFQIFLKSTAPDVEKVLNQLKKQSSEEILQKYTDIYSSLNLKDIKGDPSTILVNFQMTLIRMLAYFENLKKIATNMVAAKVNYYKCVDDLRKNVLSAYEKNCLETYVPSGTPALFGQYATTSNPFDKTSKNTVSEQTQVLNSYEYILDFITVTEKDIRSFLEAIEQKEKLQSSKDKLAEKQRSLSGNLQTVISGKTTMKSLITRKNKDDELANVELKIDEVKKDYECTTALVEMVTQILAYVQIKEFKERKTSRYYKVVQRAALREVELLKALRGNWQEILSNPTVQKEAALL